MKTSRIFVVTKTTSRGFVDIVAAYYDESYAEMHCDEANGAFRDSADSFDFVPVDLLVDGDE